MSLRWWAGFALVVVAVVLLAPALDLGAVRTTLAAAGAEPPALVAVLGLYGAAFGLRAGLLRRVLPAVSWGQALAALHVSLGGNHVLPLRLGEVLRVTSLVRRAGVPVDAATAATVGLRAADVLAVLGIGALLGPRAVAGTAGSAGWLLVVPAVAAWGGAAWWLRRVARRRTLDVRAPGPLVAVGATLAWVLEAALVWQTARWAGIAIDPLDALLVTAVTIAAQTVAVAPGGLGTYEAAATAALVALGADPAPALAAAVTAHALKTAYAITVGAVATFIPAPTMFGHLRLPHRPTAAERFGAEAIPGATAAAMTTAGPGGAAQAVGPAGGRVHVTGVGDGPVVLFLPAHDEVEAVGDVVRRVPAEVHGRPVVCLVVDDGSTDGTADVAEAAGAEVVGLGRHRGLGAAVRRGLAEGVARGAAVVAFCDADGEYAPEELGRLVAPVLEGRADYVVGSRFAGRPRAMGLHRELGNRLLTAALRLVARTPLTDGQSGYRALSTTAAAHAEVVHDYNYAQVLTLDLLAKGYRYAEVPIRYRFRTTGRSFIRLGTYLRTVLPAVARELNAPVRDPAGADARPRPAAV